ncbi:hypothetical protein FOA52_000559 [Chlamydomonas sp. UWO 241]|nr:hypothetical protein FOA52_000559 [Chlamydomonas sp. UWO 241]
MRGEGARTCVRKFMQYMELDVPSRLAYKCGRARALETGMLSNIGSNAALVHRSKARIPLLPTSTLHGWAGGLPVVVPPGTQPALRDVYVHYCRFAQKDNILYMSRSQLLRCARDCRLLGNSMDDVALDLLFNTIYLSSPDQVPGIRLGLCDWLRALLCIALVMYPEHDLQAAFDAVVHGHVLAHAACARGAGALDALDDVVAREDVCMALEEYEGALLRVFEFYVDEQELVAGAAGARRGGGGGGASAMSWADIVSAKNALPLGAFLRFAQDFELVPKLSSKGGFVDAFRRAAVGPSIASAASQSTNHRDEAPPFGPGISCKDDAADDVDMSRIGFDAFLEAVARVALGAYNYTELVEEAHKQVFDAYSPPAKMLWLDNAKEMLAEMLAFPDEVRMPSAALSCALGQEDAAQLDDTASRCASKVFTARSVRTAGQARVVTHRGAEVMAIHGTGEAPGSHFPGGGGADTQTPLHLAHFRADWVGRPPTPTHELDRLQPARQRATSASAGARGLLSGAGAPQQQQQSLLRPGAARPCSAGAWGAAPPGFVTPASSCGVHAMLRGEVTMVHMVEARAAAEAVSAGLKLRVVAERRQSTRAALDVQKAWRAQLQVASGQTVSINTVQRTLAAGDTPSVGAWGGGAAVALSLDHTGGGSAVFGCSTSMGARLSGDGAPPSSCAREPHQHYRGQGTKAGAKARIASAPVSRRGAPPAGGLAVVHVGGLGYSGHGTGGLLGVSGKNVGGSSTLADELVGILADV